MQRSLIQPQFRSDGGFALVESMMAVIVVGIVAAVAIPRYVSHIRASETAEVGQLGREIVSAMNAYVDSEELPASAAVTLFNSAYLIGTGDTAPAGTALGTIVPQLDLPADAKFDYQVSAATATTGPASGNVVYCIRATGRSTAGNAGGVVLYSSIPSRTAAGWHGNINSIPYASDTSGMPPGGVTAGGYCTGAGAASAAWNG
jgi:prepilin-type N-terminal cleavage/methylation domain-containing protein